MTPDETTTATRREGIYDEQIGLLMARIIEICKRESLPMFACFYLDPTEGEGELLKCTTLMQDGGTPEQAREEIADCYAVVGRGARVKTALDETMIRAYRAQLAREAGQS